ncbi:MAG: SdiA-regulated domain-containing protein [Candidatus Marinimicrobia bacterium]|nr:SdiA-regulated domain-containing protein [Candidatus Neomarinimicrobiota bacterium]
MKYILAAALILLTACNIFDSSKPDDSTALVLIQEIQLDISEPSGLSIDTVSGHLYCVNDPPNNLVHRLDLNGDLKVTFAYNGDDLEGICFDPRDNSVWIIEEGRGQLIHLSESGSFITQTDINYPLNSSSGLEGVAYEASTQSFLVLKQKNPAVIILIDSNLVTQESKQINFASDISGICPGRNLGEYLILSSEDKRLFEWSWVDGVIATYRFDIKQAEGVAFDQSTDRIYIVCDAESILYTYHFPEE